MALKIAAVLVGSTIAPCCCGLTCNVLASSLCGHAGKSCSWFEEFEDPEADPPVEKSCPPKFYRTRTDYFTYDFACSYSDGYDHGGIGYTISVETSGTILIKRVRTWTWNNETGTCDFSDQVTATGVVTRTVSWTEYVFGSVTTFNGSETFEAGDAYFHDGIGAYVIPMPRISASGTICYGEDCVADIAGLDRGGCFVTQQVISPGVFTAVSGSQGEYRNTTIAPGGIVMDPPPIISVELSDEVNLFDELQRRICREEPCASSDDPPHPNGCRYCCTDRGSGQEGLAYKDPLEPEGCIIPTKETVTWDVSPCDSSGDREGRSTRLSLWFKDLEPGKRYKVKLQYLRHEFSKNESDEYILPSCSAIGPYEEGFSVLDDEIVFEAENWAEVISWDCGQCEIQLKLCELEDEAEIWNAAHPEDPPRTVGCSTLVIPMPVAKNHYTFLSACGLEELPDEE